MKNSTTNNVTLLPGQGKPLTDHDRSRHLVNILNYHVLEYIFYYFSLFYTLYCIGVLKELQLFNCSDNQLLVTA